MKEHPDRIPAARRCLRPLFVLVLAALVSGCASMLIGGAATSAVVATDPRTAGTVVEDQSIELKAGKALRDDPELKEQAHLSVTSYNMAVLLAGQAPTEALRDRAVGIVRGIEKVRHVHNEITIAAPSSMMTRTADSTLTAKVKTRLFANKNLNAAHVKVVTEDGTVFLMGLVPESQGRIAAEVASTTGGVQRVVKLFEYR